MLGARLEHHLGAADVRDQRAQRIFEDVTDAHRRCKVEHPITLRNQTTDQRQIRDAALQETEFGIALERAKVAKSTGREIVQRPDLGARREQVFAEVRPYESSTPGNEDSHALPSGWIADGGVPVQTEGIPSPAMLASWWFKEAASSRRQTAELTCAAKRVANSVSSDSPAQLVEPQSERRSRVDSARRATIRLPYSVAQSRSACHAQNSRRANFPGFFSAPGSPGAPSA